MDCRGGCLAGRWNELRHLRDAGGGGWIRVSVLVYPNKRGRCE